MIACFEFLSYAYNKLPCASVTMFIIIIFTYIIMLILKWFLSST